MERFISMKLLGKFRLAEFDRILRQDNEIFVNLLNRKRLGDAGQNKEHVIKSRFTEKYDRQK